MLFNSVAYLIFLPLVVLLYYLLPVKWRWMMLLAASYVFYAYWKVEYLILIVASTLVDYVVSNKLGTTQSKLGRRLLLSISVLTNLGILFLFKYLKLFLVPKDLMHMSITAAEHPFLGEIYYALYLVIPVGISFYTFQTLSYTMDVYWRKIKPEKHLGKFALFVCFFPQLVAGPIERFSSLRPQLDGQTFFDYNHIRNGLRLILYGFFLKLCIADNLASTVDLVYENPLGYSSLSLLSGTFLFGFQIYCDFAGYSLIAQGSALLLGIKLMDNFRTPYLSKSISEFWQRWHISLSTWFRDYLYIPLGGNRINWKRWIVNIMLVFAISGFWHGAQWTFLIWGAIHGLLYLIERAIKTVNIKSTLSGYFGWFGTLVAVMIAWVFFRAGSLDKIDLIWQGLIANEGQTKLEFSQWFVLPVILFIASELLLYNNRFDRWIANKSVVLRWSVYALMIFCIAALGGAINHPFIYFQF